MFKHMGSSGALHPWVGRGLILDTQNVLLVHGRYVICLT